MSFRPLLALVLGLGLSLTGCIADDAEVDLDDQPGMNAECTDCAGGSGYNGAYPMFECLPGAVFAMTGWPGYSQGYRGWSGSNWANGTYTYNYNTSLDYVRCDGSLHTLNDTYPSPKIATQTDVLKSMAWTGVSQSYGVVNNGVTNWGSGWFATNWATTPFTADKADLVGALIIAKWNRNKNVPIFVEAPNLDGLNVTVGADPATYGYTIPEALIVYPSYQNTARYAMMIVPEAFKSACPNYLLWYNRRVCHDGSCGVNLYDENVIPSACVQSDLVTPATGIGDAYRCGIFSDRARVVRTYVKPASLEKDPDCH